MKFIPSFKKSKLQKILEKYKKLVESEIFKKVMETELEIENLFYDESEKCKYYEYKKSYISVRVCNNKKGKGTCNIVNCPLK